MKDSHGERALLRYAAPLLQDAGAPGFPIEIPFAGHWSAAFGTFCANVANSLAEIVIAGSAVAPKRVDRSRMRSSKRPHR